MNLENFKNDKGSAVLVTGVISILFICLCLGFAVDVSKNSYLRDSYQSMAQKSAESSVKKIRPDGSLKIDQPNSAQDILISEYIKQKVANLGVSNTDPDNIANSKKMYGECGTRVIDGVERSMPYIEVSFDNQRRIGTEGLVAYESENGNPALLKNPEGFNVMNKYTVINAKIHDSSQNYFLGMFGLPCQDFTSNVSAITFGSQEDLDENIGTGS